MNNRNKRNSPTHTLNFVDVAASGFDLDDFSGNTNALKDIPFNFARVINNSNEDFNVFLDRDTTFCPSGTIIPIDLDNRVFRVVRVENLGAAQATIKVEVSNVNKASDIVNEGLLSKIQKFNKLFGG